MKVELDLQIAPELAILKGMLPSLEQCTGWVNTTLEKANYPHTTAELHVRIVDLAESQQLNNQYRHKDKPTNVLSFPAHIPAHIPINLLGDLAICAPVVCAEAERDGKLIEAHWAHMLVHGSLHLLGYDHEEEQQANIMEALEISILQSLGFVNPYQEETT